MNVAPNTTFEAVASGFATGLAGTIGVRIIDNSGSTTVTRTTAGITEYPAGSGIYVRTFTGGLPTTGQYTLVWDNGSTTPGNVAVEDLVITTGGGSVIGSPGPYYITTAALKATLTLTGTTYADADITAAIAAASRAIDNLCQRRFFQDADANQVRYYTPGDDILAQGLLDIDDLVTMTSLLTSDDGTTFANTWTANTDYVLEPLNAASDVWPYTHIRALPQGSFRFNTIYPRSVKLTGMFGWPAVPDAVVNATTLLANRILTISRSAPLGIMPFEGGAIRIARADSQVMMLVGPYMRHASSVA